MPRFCHPTPVFASIIILKIRDGGCENVLVYVVFDCESVLFCFCCCDENIVVKTVVSAQVLLMRLIPHIIRAGDDSFAPFISKHMDLLSFAGHTTERRYREKTAGVVTAEQRTGHRVNCFTSYYNEPCAI